MLASSMTFNKKDLVCWDINTSSVKDEDNHERRREKKLLACHITDDDIIVQTSPQGSIHNSPLPSGEFRKERQPLRSHQKLSPLLWLFFEIIDFSYDGSREIDVHLIWCSHELSQKAC